ncbi:hypothetical protein EGW08_016544 [Elysia chlorotica]|uniref:G-protein coupled receptors family 1 profile domain-containing protein n=1 Tax=Elysia chlorotica TaxID=188477 RepID=A0A3S1HB18_ELYCH|nr:hypothetical protein EGW08_016544 [Elysia chlorotica]
MELTTENPHGIFSENASLKPIFNWSGHSNETIKEEDGPSSRTLMASAIYLCIVAFFAILGNITVLTIIFRDKKLRSKPHNHLLIALAFCDMSVLFGGYPFTIISACFGKWVFGDGTCIFAGFFTFFVSLTSMNILVAICVFRYIMICLPGKSFLLTPRFTSYVILICFCYGFFWTALPLVV